MGGKAPPYNIHVHTFPYIVLKVSAISNRCTIDLLPKISVIACSSVPKPFIAALNTSESNLGSNGSAGKTVAEHYKV